MTSEQMDIILRELEICKDNTNEVINHLMNNLKETGVYKLKSYDNNERLSICVRIAFYKALSIESEKLASLNGLKLLIL